MDKETFFNEITEFKERLGDMNTPMNNGEILSAYAYFQGLSQAEKAEEDAKSFREKLMAVKGAHHNTESEDGTQSDHSSVEW